MDTSKDLEPNKDLEDAVKEMGEKPMHPIVSRVTRKLGAFNLIRNARNQKQVDIERIDEAAKS